MMTSLKNILCNQNQWVQEAVMAAIKQQIDSVHLSLLIVVSYTNKNKMHVHFYSVFLLWLSWSYALSLLITRVTPAVADRVHMILCVGSEEK